MEIVLIVLLVVGSLIVTAVVKSRRRAGERKERAAFIQRYSFPPELRAKLQRDHGFDLEQSGLILEGLRQYFLACLSAQRGGFSKVVGMPSKAVDAAWHEFILMTRDYEKFCEQAFGKYLHHTPAEQMKESDDRAMANTLHQVSSPGISPAGWAMLGTMPLLFAMDRHLGMKEGLIYDDNAFGELQKSRDHYLSTMTSHSSSDSSSSWSSSDSSSDSGSSWFGGGDSGGSSDSGNSSSCGSSSSCGGSSSE